MTDAFQKSKRSSLTCKDKQTSYKPPDGALMDKFIEFTRAYKTESQRSAYDLQHRNTWKD